MRNLHPAALWIGAAVGLASLGAAPGPALPYAGLPDLEEYRPGDTPPAPSATQGGVATTGSAQAGLTQQPGVLKLSSRGYLYAPGQWKTVVIPVCWEPGTPQGAERLWVESAVQQSWQAESKLQFIGWKQCAATAVGIRIAVADDGPNDGPHTVNLGNTIDKVPSGMVLNFTFNTWSPGCATAALREKCIRSVAVHEFGHAIGFAHEQNRPDTPGDCRNKNLSQGPNGTETLTAWDANSVMNYCNGTWLNGGRLSDKESVHAIYGVHG